MKIREILKKIYIYSGIKYIFVFLDLHRFVAHGRTVNKDYKLRGIQFLKESDLENKKTILAKGLDKESQEVIDLITSRYLHAATHNFYSPISKKEILEQKRIEKIWKNLDKRDPYYSHINIFLHFYHRGLKTLDDTMLNKIRDYINNKDVIDAGAYTGDSALMFKKEYNIKRVFAFEPEDLNYKTLENNIKTNGWKDIVPVKKGLGNKVDEKLQITSGGMGSTTLLTELLNEEESKQTIELTTLDSFVDNRKINVGLIKMDIEGGEPKAVEGAMNTIKRMRPVLLIAIYHGSKDFFEIKPYLDQSNINYQFYIRKTGPHPVAGVILIGIPKELI